MGRFCRVAVLTRDCFYPARAVGLALEARVVAGRTGGSVDLLFEGSVTKRQMIANKG